MKVKDFDFDLPQHLIAQSPLDQRSDSRLLVVDGDHFTDRRFRDIGEYLNRGDVLVINDTRVIAARLLGIKSETGARIELLILRFSGNKAHCLVGNAKAVKKGTEVIFGDGRLKAVCIAVHDEGLRDFELIHEGILLELLDELGHMPLPPYIHETLADKQRYQTVYAKVSGSAAAPTAGLHFTKELIAELTSKGVLIVPVTLHVGLGTFRPVKTENVSDHVMHSESYFITPESAQLLNQARLDKRRIVAVGTTSARTLETVISRHGHFLAGAGESDIFIVPGYHFQAVDALITNFHLPQSTLIMMISAFAGKARTFAAYDHAIKQQYRFFSFGDSMFIVGKEL